MPQYDRQRPTPNRATISELDRNESQGKWEGYLLHDPNLVSLRGMYARSKCARRVLDHEYPRPFIRCTPSEIQAVIESFLEYAGSPQDKTAMLAILELAQSAQKTQVLEQDLKKAISLADQKISAYFLPALQNLTLSLGIRANPAEIKACVDDLLQFDPHTHVHSPSFDTFARKYLRNNFSEHTKPF